MSKPIVISLGEILWDMLPTGKRAGGAPVNFAYHASQNGAESFAISAVGNDELGTELLSDAHKAGINTLVQTNEYPTGTVDVALTNGIPEYTIVENVAWDHIKLTDELVEAVSKADAVCFGTLGLRSPESHDTIVELLKHTKEGALKFFDINLRANFYSNELIEELLGYANIFKINDEELIMMRDMFSIPECNDEEACKWFIDRFDLEYIILTGGATFSTITTKNGEVSTLLTPHVEGCRYRWCRRLLLRFLHRQAADRHAAQGSASRGREHRRLRVHQGRRLADLPCGRRSGLSHRSRQVSPDFFFHHHQRGHVCHHGLVFHTHIQSAIGAITIVTIYAPQRRMMP